MILKTGGREALLCDDRRHDYTASSGYVEKRACIFLMEIRKLPSFLLGTCCKIQGERWTEERCIKQNSLLF